jgi:hypothetical protein
MVIDGGPPMFLVPPVQSAAVTINNLIFNSGDLSDGNHTLVVAAENDHTLWIDYVLLTPSAPSAPASSGASPTSLTPSASMHTAAIVGASVGAVVLLAIAVAALFFLRRRKRRRALQASDREVHHIETFIC